LEDNVSKLRFQIEALITVLFEVSIEILAKQLDNKAVVISEQEVVYIMHNMPLICIQAVIAFSVSEPLHDRSLRPTSIVVLHGDALVDLYCHFSLGLMVETPDYLPESSTIQLFHNLETISYVVANNDLIKASLSIESIIVVLIRMTHAVTS
jgi:hypothetical protein